jgi:hypothetical protein
VALEEGHAKVEEDDAVTSGAEHLDEVVDGGQRLAGDVLEGVVGLDEAAAYEGDDTRPGEKGSGAEEN